MESVAIELKNVSKSFEINSQKGIFSLFQKAKTERRKFKRLTALEDISFTIQRGETIGVMGLNGQGKTTLLKIIAGIYKPDSGTVSVHGKLAPLLQVGTGFNNELDATENIIIYGMLLGFKKNEIQAKIDKIIKFAELEKFRHMKLKNFSSGMRARLGFATALEVEPDIMLVDEVLSVGDQAFREKSYNAFLAFKKNNKTVVFTAHSDTLISELSDRVILIDKGHIAKIGKSEEVIPVYKEIVNAHKNKTSSK
jgi:ABC-type polysaccharide/polyol phosphate transport system ATPase subunit